MNTYLFTMDDFFIVEYEKKNYIYILKKKK